MYTPYDWNESINQRAEYIEKRLESGSPVIGLSYDQGLLLLTVRAAQRKVFEIYDHLMYSAVGNPSDVESIRLAAIDFCHQEGYQRSPDDVSAQRLIGFQLGPALKKAFAEAMSAPFVVRAVFAEIGKTAATDQFYVLNYDGDFIAHKNAVAIAGGRDNEERMADRLREVDTDNLALPRAVQTALQVWALGKQSRRQIGQDDDEVESENQINGAAVDDILREALKKGQVEAAVLQRDVSRENKFRLLKESEIKPYIEQYLD